jgi:hypothetical protein
VREGVNAIRFRFDQTDGVASGFRVVALNLLDAAGVRLLPADSFAQENLGTWTPPLSDPESIRAGGQLWLNAPLTASGLPNAPPIRAHCADCHAYDGRDLKYFNFSNASIAARSRFHGLSDLQGRQIASYIRSRPGPNPGRPWNPPYQPGPGLDAQPVAHWAAGAGLASVLDDDLATLPFILAAARTNDLRPDGNLNPREIPIALPLPDWNRWLPRVHPLDAWGAAFERSEFAQLYGTSRSSLRRQLAASNLSSLISSGRIVTAFDNWTKAREALLRPYVGREDVRWTPDLAQKAYATQLWQLVKTWEVTQEFGLEGRGREFYGSTGEPRTWFSTAAAAAAPATTNIPSGPAGMGGSALTNEYFNAAWYQLQILLNTGNHRHRNRLPVDWLYLIGGTGDLHAESRRPEPARVLVMLIKALQSTDPAIGPQDVAQGWRPGQQVDPTLLVHPDWAPIFQPLPADERRVILETLLAAWLEKNQQYRIDRYFRAGLTESSYAAPAKYASLAGGKAWEAAPHLLAAGVSSALVQHLQQWGASYTEMAARFQYSSGAGRRGQATEVNSRGGR